MSIKPNEIIHQVESPSLKHPKHYHHHITIILSSAHWTDFLKKQRHLSVMLLLKVLPKRRHYRYLPFLKRSHWQPPTPCIVQPEFILGNHWVNWVSLQSTCEGWCRVVGPPPFTHRLALKAFTQQRQGLPQGCINGPLSHRVPQLYILVLRRPLAIRLNCIQQVVVSNEILR